MTPSTSVALPVRPRDAIPRRRLPHAAFFFEGRPADLKRGASEAETAPAARPCQADG